MGKQTDKLPVQNSDAINSGDYERGLRVLAKLIARLHIEKALNEKESTDGVE